MLNYVLHKMSKKKKKKTTSELDKVQNWVFPALRPLQISCIWNLIYMPTLLPCIFQIPFLIPMVKLVLVPLHYWLFSLPIPSALHCDFPTFVESIAPIWPAPSPNNLLPLQPNNPVLLNPPQERKPSGGGLNGGQKAGEAIGVHAGTGLIAFGGLVYKKPCDNIRRSRYGFAATNTFFNIYTYVCRLYMYL